MERAKPEFLAELAANRNRRECCWAVTAYSESDGETIVAAHADSSAPGRFAQEIAPQFQLAAIGAGPEDSALCRLAESMGWTWQSSECASQLAICWDRWTAALVKTHNYGRDFAALRFLLPRPLRYVGLIGPKRRKMQLLHDLIDSEVSIPAHFFAPAGQNIGGETPESIALAVVAEIHAVMEKHPGNHLRDVSAPIHSAGENRASRVETKVFANARSFEAVR